MVVSQYEYDNHIILRLLHVTIFAVNGATHRVFKISRVLWLFIGELPRIFCNVSKLEIGKRRWSLNHS